MINWQKSRASKSQAQAINAELPQKMPSLCQIPQTVAFMPTASKKMPMTFFQTKVI